MLSTQLRSIHPTCVRAAGARWLWADERPASAPAVRGIHDMELAGVMASCLCHGFYAGVGSDSYTSAKSQPPVPSQTVKPSR